MEESDNPLLERSADLAEEVYDSCCYIVPVVQAKPEVVLLTATEVSVLRDDGPSQGLDNLAKLEEGLDNLQFYDEQDQGNVQIDWFDLNRSTDNSGWLSDEPDQEKETRPKPEEKESRTVAVAGMAEDKGKLSESTGIKNLAQELGVVSTVDAEHKAALKWFVQERNQGE